MKCVGDVMRALGKNNNNNNKLFKLYHLFLCFAFQCNNLVYNLLLFYYYFVLFLWGYKIILNHLAFLMVSIFHDNLDRLFLIV